MLNIADAEVSVVPREGEVGRDSAAAATGEAAPEGLVLDAVSSGATTAVPTEEATNGANRKIPADDEALHEFKIPRPQAVWRPDGPTVEELVGADSQTNTTYFPELTAPAESSWKWRWGLFFYEDKDVVGAQTVWLSMEKHLLRIQEFRRPQTHQWFSTGFFLGVRGPMNYYSRTFDVDLFNVRAVVRDGNYGVPRPAFEARPQERIGRNLAGSLTSAMTKGLNLAMAGLGAAVGFVVSSCPKMIMLALSAIPMVLAWRIYATKDDTVSVLEWLVWISIALVPLLAVHWFLLLSTSKCAQRAIEITGQKHIDLAGFKREKSLNHARWMMLVNVIMVLSLACATLCACSSLISFYEMTHNASEVESNMAGSQCPDTWCSPNSPEDLCDCSSMDVMFCLKAGNKADSKSRLMKSDLDMCDSKIHVLLALNVIFSTCTFAALLLFGLLLWLDHRLDKLNGNDDNRMDYSEVKIFGCDVVKPSNQNILHLASLTLWSGDAEVLLHKLSQFIHSEEHYAARAAQMQAA